MSFISYKASYRLVAMIYMINYTLSSYIVKNCRIAIFVLESVYLWTVSLIDASIQYYFDTKLI